MTPPDLSTRSSVSATVTGTEPVVFDGNLLAGCRVDEAAGLTLFEAAGLTLFEAAGLTLFEAAEVAATARGEGVVLTSGEHARAAR